MKSPIFIALLILVSQIAFSQSEPLMGKTNQKGNLYVYWGWNRGWHTNSDISFQGPDYNFRIGYFIQNNYDISFGVDHMKYVVQSGQTVKISGNISNTETEYDGVYDNDDIQIEEGFLLFEHTDGLNYVNVEFRRFDNIFDFNKIKINLTEGVGLGVLVPKTNSTLLNKERYDEFHMAGYGIGAVVAINISFYEIFFIQSELKGGYINMPDIRTTMNKADGASQSFFYSQLNIVFGISLSLGKKA